MKSYINLSDFKEFPITTKKGKKSKIKLYSCHLILDKKKYEFKDLPNWGFTSKNLFFFILSTNHITYFTSTFCKEIHDELKDKYDNIKKDKILTR